MNIEFVNATFAKNDHVILKDVDLEIRSGRNYAIIGHTGSGKTTLLEAIASKIFPKSGKVNKASNVEFVPSDYKFHRFVGAVYQYYQQRYHAYDSEIGPTLYEVLQNQVKPMGTIDERSVELDPPLHSEDHLLRVCKVLKIDHLLNRQITSLSTGETRRSLLARSILKHPDFLLLDNPYIGLDKEGRALLNEILQSLDNMSLVIVAGVNDFPNHIHEYLLVKDESVESFETKDLLLQNYSPSKRFKLDNELLKKVAGNDHDVFETAVRFTKAQVKYGSQFALQDFNWEVKKGERWALMGPNGSGKSTIISLITADNPQAYRNDLLLFDKKRGTGESIWDIKKRIGFVSSELQLYFDRDIPVWKLVASGLFDTLGLFKELSDPELMQVFDYIKLIGIQDIAERPLNQISNGETRLAFLARAIVKDPPILILDEPCQGLDYNQMVHFRDLLNDLVSSFNKTLIYVTHYEEEIPPSVNRRLDISDGRVIKIS